MGALLNPLVAEEETTIADTDFPDLPGVYFFNPGMVFLLSGSGDADSEFILLKSVNGSDLTFTRGLYDTVPRDHLVGASIWYIDPNSRITDRSVRVAGASVPFQFQPRTSNGLLPLAEAPVVNYTPIERYQAPFRPAQTAMEGDPGLGMYVFGSEVSTISVSWVNRNRTLEDAVALAWDEAGVTPEPGQTTILELRNGSGQVLQTYTVPEGDTSYAIPVADLYSGKNFSVTYLSERDGLRSVQGFTRDFQYPFVPAGYGQSYGVNYGP